MLGSRLPIREFAQLQVFWRERSERFKRFRRAIIVGSPNVHCAPWHRVLLWITEHLKFYSLTNMDSTVVIAKSKRQGTRELEDDLKKYVCWNIECGVYSGL